MKLSYAVIKPTRELADGNLEIIDGNNVVLEFAEAEGASELDILQKAVGGYIEPLTHFFPWAEEICLQVYGDAEAAIYGLPISCAVIHSGYPPEDPRQRIAWLRGNLVFVRTEEYGGNLTEYDKDLIRDKFYWGVDYNIDNPDNPDSNYYLRPFFQFI